MSNDVGPRDGSPLFQSSVPLGGLGPSEEALPKAGFRRDLLLAALLFVTAVIAGASSLMPWRDYMFQSPGGFNETGWLRMDGNLGRGWMTVIYAMFLAIAGLLIAARRERLGRLLAVLSGIALMVLATVEWGLGDAGSRNGPGIGLWVELLVGAAAVLAVGMITPTQTKH